LEKISKIYRRALNFCKGDIYSIYKWHYEYLNLFGLTDSQHNDNNGNIFNSSEFENVKKLLGITQGSALKNKK
jgi:hypothetical protein